MGQRTRREILRAGAVATVLSGVGTGTTVAAGDGPGRQSADGWPTYMHDARNTGAAPASAGPGGDVTVAWQTMVNGTNRESPAYADGTLFVLANDALVALDAATGAEQWRLTEFRATPTVTADALYRTAADPARFDRETREMAWSRNGGHVIDQGPTLADGRLYVPFVGDTDKMLALDPASGDLQWQSSVPGVPAGAPAVADDRVFVSADRGLVAFDGATGEKLWQRERDAPSVPPVVARDVVLAEMETLTAFDAATGEQVWTTDLSPDGTPTVADGSVYVPASGRVEVFDLASGERTDEFRTGTWTDMVAVAGDYLYRGFGVYDRRSGDAVWELPRGDAHPSPPVVGGGRAYFVTESGFAVALASADSVDDPVLGGRSGVTSRVAGATAAFKAGPRRTGAVDAPGPGPDHEVTWTVETTAGRFGPPALVDGRTYVVRGATGEDADAKLVVLSGGDLVWQHPTGTVENDAARLPGVAVADGRVYAGGRESDVVRAWRVDAGESVWQVPLAGAGCPTVADGTVFTDTVNALEDGRLGASRWRTGSRPSGWLQLAPAVDADRVYTLSRDGLRGLARGSGEVDWEYSDATARNGPAVVDGTVLAATDSGACLALTRDGSVRWNTGLDRRSRASPAVADGTVVLGDDAGVVHALALDDGSRRWRAELDGAVRASATIARQAGTAFVGTESGTLYALAMDDGSVRWTYDAGETVTGPPAIEGGRLVVPADDRLVALAPVGGLDTPTATTPATRGTPGPAATTGGGADRDDGSVSPVGRIVDSASDSPALVGGVAVGSLGVTTAGAVAVRRWVTDDGDDTVGESTDTGADGPPSGGTSGGSGAGGGGGGGTDALTQSVVETHETSQRLPRLPDGLALPDFERTAQIGSGATADVYRATVADETVALKISRLSGDDTVDRSVFEEFAEEAGIWARIDDHDHVVSALDWGAEPSPWIALELMDAGDLRRYVGEFGHGDAVATVSAVASAVAHAHDRGVIHTDLKPANVLFRETDEGTVVPKVADWGVATVLEAHSRSVKGLTPACSAPEQLSPDEYGGTDERTDVFQLGVLAYETLTGARPFGGDTAPATMRAVLSGNVTRPTSRDPDLPGRVDRVLGRALSTPPDDRYGDPVAFRNALVDCW